MNARKTLALAAMTLPLLLGFTACGGSEDSDGSYHLIVNGEDRGLVNGDDDPGTVQAAPTDFADENAKAALEQVCPKLSTEQVASLLEVPALEQRDGVTKEDDSVDGIYDNEGSGNVFCSFVQPGADEYGSTGWDGAQTFASISVAGPAVKPCEGCSGGTVEFADGSIGYYSGTDETSLRVTPAGSAYEFSFSVVLPYEATTASGLDRETTDNWREKAAEMAHLALD